MISLTPGYGQYVRSGIEFVVNFCNGKVYLTDAEYCRLSSIPIGRVLDRLDEMQEGIYWHDIPICPTHRKERKKSVRLIPAETIFDWLLVDRRTIAERLARDTDEFAVYIYRLAGSTIHLLESVKSIIKAQETENLRIQVLSLKVFEVTAAAYQLRLGEEIGSEHPYGWLKVFDEVELSELIAEIEKDYRLVESEPAACDRIEATIYEWHESAIANSSPELAAAFSDEIEPVLLAKPTAENTEDYLTVWQYLETISEIGENDSLNDAILLNAAAINVCKNRGLEPREIISNRLGTVYAFPVSVLKQLDKKRKTVSDDENEHYFTIPQYFNLVSNRQKEISLSDAITLNALAFNICKEKRIEIKQETFTTLGIMNAFPLSIIEQVERYLN